MASNAFSNQISSQPILAGRGGYNKDGEEEDDNRMAPMNFGRGGYNAPNRGPDDDEEEDGRGGYN